MGTPVLLRRVLGGQTLEGGNGDVGDDGVEALALGGSLGVLGDLALDEDADTAGNTLHATVPEVSVEGSVDAVVLGLHELSDNLLDLLDGDGGTLVEGALLEDLGEVDGALDGDGVRLAALLLEEGAAGGTTAASVLGGVSDTLVLLLLLVVHLGEGALPLLVVLVAAALGGLLAVSNKLELLLLVHVLTSTADHFVVESPSRKR
jgi:hypothetical protein